MDFDFVVVGAGASGCVLANRLSADPACRVLVIEAGPAAYPGVEAAGRWTELLDSPVDWRYLTEPSPQWDQRAIAWPAGRVLGGSTAINAMAYVRGHASVFDRWAAIAGARWAFEHVRPVFEALEATLAIEPAGTPHAGHLAFLDAAASRGFGADSRFDFDGPRQHGVAGFYRKMQRHGRRESAATAFLDPIASRSNLSIWTSARAVRITTTAHRRATGVDVMREGGPVHVTAGREVLVAAGAIETPKLLLLSGIGPAAELEAAGVGVVLDLPGVGRQLHDHPRVPVRWHAREPLAPSSVTAGLFAHSSLASPDHAPDLQFYVGRGLDQVDPFVTLTVAFTQPESRGSVTLRSPNPDAAPVIRPNYASAARDREALVEAVQLAVDLGESAAFDRLRGEPIDRPDPGSGQQGVEAHIRRLAGTIFHPAGTCRMGEDDEAVVDGDLRVRGIEGLRVADASVMPSPVNSQTAASCFLIGELTARAVFR